MIALLITGAACGSLFTWAVTKFVYDKKRRDYLRDTTAQMQQSIDIQDRCYAANAMLYLSALRAVEGGDYETAKRDVASGAAIFYRQFSSPDQCEVVQSQRREVELLARSSKALRDALDRHKQDPAASVDR